MTFSPLRYTPSAEQPEKDEDQVALDLVETMLSISKNTLEHSGHAMRSVHVKGHAVLQGNLEVKSGLPEALAQGLFSNPGHYPVIMRFSASPGDMLSDSVSTPRGLAIKILNVKGERLPGSEGATTQDFVMVNSEKSFVTPNAKAFLNNLKMFARTANKAEGAKKVISATMRGAQKVLQTFGSDSNKIRNFSGEPAVNPLGESYFTQVPLLYGNYMAKVSLAPASSALKELTGKPVNIGESSNALRDEMLTFFASHGGEWELRAQLCTDLESMPVEDASAVWPEDKSPYVTVGRIKVPPQKSWSEPDATAIQDKLSFSPWHGLAAHRPIGSIMRVRKLAYEKSAQFRASHNNCALEEPETLSDVFPNNATISKAAV